VMFVGLEILSVAVYVLAAMHSKRVSSQEAGLKYFVLGAIASGLLLYGMSLLYGVTGSLDLATVSAAVADGQIARAPLMLALAFVVVGLTFKLGAVPFHMWVPDVYHGAPTSVTLFIGSAPKIAAFALLMRMLVDGLESLHADWQQLLIILSVLSLAIGNIVAIAQTNIKRMLAYSTISHVGFLLLGVLAGTAAGYSASMFYALVYALMAAGGFAMVLLLSRQGFEGDRLDDFRGLNERSPWFAFVMLILMASMAGLPPTVGFFAKVEVLAAVVDVELVWLAVVAVAFSIVGAYYYLRVIKLMYFDQAEDTHALAVGPEFKVALSANGLAVLGLGLFPGLLLGLCAAVFL
ncbi:MAG: NADH-quinone oxidoreductase subunit NuoN, partial [Gammaproteobacteria bacterium]